MLLCAKKLVFRRSIHKLFSLYLYLYTSISPIPALWTDSQPPGLRCPQHPLHHPPPSHPPPPQDQLRQEEAGVRQRRHHRPRQQPWTAIPRHRRVCPGGCFCRFVSRGQLDVYVLGLGFSGRRGGEDAQCADACYYVRVSIVYYVHESIMSVWVLCHYVHVSVIMSLWVLCHYVRVSVVVS